MKKIDPIIFLTLAILLLVSCGPEVPSTPVFLSENPYAPHAGDSDLMAGEITVDSSSLVLTKSQPPQIIVNFAYFQPTPCYQLRVEISGPDADHRINLKAYALAERDVPCSLMALATPLQASLNLGSFPSRHYFVLLNGEQIGEFDS